MMLLTKLHVAASGEQCEALTLLGGLCRVAPLTRGRARHDRGASGPGVTALGSSGRHFTPAGQSDLLVMRES